MNRISLLLILLILIGFHFHLYSQNNFNLELVAQVELGQTANDIWGYVDANDTEYAIVGTTSETRIYSLSDPNNPRLVFSEPGANSIWRDIKSYENYIYVVADQGSDGVLIIDMSNAPNAYSAKKINIPTTSDLLINRCHNLYIDTEIGIMFLAGCNSPNGVSAFDLKSDPFNPTFIGTISTNYAHDVFVQDNLVYASEFNNGQIAIYDIQDIENPVLLGSAKTSKFATHNAWADELNEYVFTTDETTEGALDVYNIKDKSNPKRIESFIPSAIKNQGYVPHNTHFLNDYLITSWYEYGLVITDVSNPEKVIETGHFDTHMGSGSGAWGAYPYLPSGLILVSDIDNGLFVLNPAYERAAFVKGKITDITTGNPIGNVSVQILSSDPNSETSDPTGNYLTGQLSEGTFTLIFDHPEYEVKEVEVSLSKDEIKTIDIQLDRSPQFNLFFQTVTEIDEGIGQADIALISEENEYYLKTNSQGSVTQNIIKGTYNVIAGKWGYYYSVIENLEIIEDVGGYTLQLDPGYEDNFIFDFGWVAKAANERSKWVRVKPIQTTYLGMVSNPGNDILDDFGDLCFVTGNGAGGAGQYDVDDGATTLTTPSMDLSGEWNYFLNFSGWFYNNGGSGTMPNDSFSISITNGTDTTKLVVIDQSLGDWTKYQNINLGDFIDLNETVKIIFETADDADGHLVEAGVDGFKIIQTPLTNVVDQQNKTDWKLLGNPVSDFIRIQNENFTQPLTLSVFSIEGQLMNKIDVASYHGQILNIGAPDRQGVYFIHVKTSNKQEFTLKFIKL